METSYTPVQYVFREVIEEEIAKKTEGKIFHFLGDNVVDAFEGIITRIEEIPGKGIFILMNDERQIRIDRIITLFGKPGAAFDEYDAYANACMNCTGGDE